MIDNLNKDNGDLDFIKKNISYHLNRKYIF